MNEFDKNMKAALPKDGAFDPSRAHVAQEEVFRDYSCKLKRSERVTLLLLYLLVAMGVCSLISFTLFATTTKELLASGLVFLFVVVVAIQKTLMHTITASQYVAMKEIKQLQLALVSGTIAKDQPVAKPLRELAPMERFAWIVGLIVLIFIVSGLSSRTNRQDNLWHLKAEGQVEAHSVLTLRRFPHTIPSFWSITGPVEGAVLQSVTFNGESVSFDHIKDQYTIKLPYQTCWFQDQIELVWTFALPDPQEIGDFRVPLRSLMPVHGYSLIAYIENDSEYEGNENAWRFNKSRKELKDEAEARRTLKAFTQDIPGGPPRDNFGVCGLPIRPRANN
jgi:hypothetical protein